MSYSSTVLGTSPSLYWRLDESSGTTATDSSTGGHDGTYGAGITLSAAGGLIGDSDAAITGQNLSTSRVTSSYAPWASNSSRTFKGLARRSNTTANHTLIGGDGSIATPSLRINTGGETVRFAIRDNDSGATSQALWTNAWPNTGVWVHWALAVNFSTHVAELYIDGASQGQVTGLTQAISIPGNLVVGCIGNTFFNRWVGDIDEISVNQSVLSAATILNDYVAARSYIDSGTATVTTSGSNTESKTFTETIAGSITSSGSKTEAATYSDSRAGSITSSGSKVESKVFSESRSGTVTTSGAKTESKTGSDSVAGALALSGLNVEFKRFSEILAGALGLSGLNSEIDVSASSPGGTVDLTLHMHEAIYDYRGGTAVSYAGTGGAATYDEEY